MHERQRDIYRLVIAVFHDETLISIFLTFDLYCTCLIRPMPAYFFRSLYIVEKILRVSTNPRLVAKVSIPTIVPKNFLPAIHSFETA